jgi:hypothetical protein
MSAIVAAVAMGAITPREGSEVASLLEIFLRAFEANKVEQRLIALEEGLRTKEPE